MTNFRISTTAPTKCINPEGEIIYGFAAKVLQDGIVLGYVVFEL